MIDYNRVIEIVSAAKIQMESDPVSEIDVPDDTNLDTLKQIIKELVALGISASAPNNHIVRDFTIKLKADIESDPVSEIEVLERVDDRITVQQLIDRINQLVELSTSEDIVIDGSNLTADFKDKLIDLFHLLRVKVNIT